jgi:hypothetical protein
VSNLQLQKGMLIGGPGAASVMSFVQDRNESNWGVVIVLFGQRNYLLIKPDQYAEVPYVYCLIGLFSRMPSTAGPL